MQASTPSSTALVTALMRALHTRADPRPILSDPWGDRLVPESVHHMLESMALARMPVGQSDARAATSVVDSFLRSSPAYTNVITRARFSEDALLSAVSRGISQYVLLGAGFDSFALRVPGEAQHLEIFEIDHPATQSLKKQRLAECGLSVSGNVHFVMADLAAEELGEVLANCGFNSKIPAFISWLGVTMYLTRAANLAALRALANCASHGSELVFNYLDQAAFDGVASAAFTEVQETVTAMGEPFVSGFHPVGLEAELRAVGLELLEDVEESQLVRAYDPTGMNSLHPVEECHTVRVRVVGRTQ